MADESVLTPQEERILIALAALPFASPVAEISAVAGCEVTTRTMKPLVSANLVALQERKKMPFIVYELTPKGHVRSSRLIAAGAEAPAPAKTASALHDRISQQQVHAAVRDRRSLSWMSLQWGAPVAEVRALLERYQTPKPTLPQPPAAPEEVQPEMTTPKRTGRPSAGNWPDDQTLIDLERSLRNQGVRVLKTLATRFGVKESNVAYRLGLARDRLGLPKPGQGVKAKDPAFTCTTCRDSGYVDGGPSGELCACSIGRRLAETTKEELLVPVCATCQNTGSVPAEGRYCDCEAGAIRAGQDEHPSSLSLTLEHTAATPEHSTALFSVAGALPSSGPAEGVGTAPQVEAPEAASEGDRVTTGLDREFVAAGIRRIKELETLLQRLDEGGDLVQTLERHAKESGPLSILILVGVDEDRSVVIPDADRPLPGEDWAERIEVEGRRSVQVWRCTETYQIEHRLRRDTICIMRLAWTGAQAKEAA